MNFTYLFNVLTFPTQEDAHAKEHRFSKTHHLDKKEVDFYQMIPFL